VGRSATPSGMRLINNCAITLLCAVQNRSPRTALKRLRCLRGLPRYHVIHCSQSSTRWLCWRQPARRVASFWSWNTQHKTQLLAFIGAISVWRVSPMRKWHAFNRRLRHCVPNVSRSPVNEAKSALTTLARVVAERSTNGAVDRDPDRENVAHRAIHALLR